MQSLHAVGRPDPTELCHAIANFLSRLRGSTLLFDRGAGLLAPEEHDIASQVGARAQPSLMRGEQSERERAIVRRIFPPMTCELAGQRRFVVAALKART